MVEAVREAFPGSATPEYQVDRNDPRWHLVERILDSPDFVRAPRLADFLRYICRAELSGHGADLSEQHIGEVVFGRPPDYDSSADTIVRSHALRLRRRLEQYFLRAGRDEAYRLDIPRGGYVPVFVERTRVLNAAITQSPDGAPGTPFIPAELAVAPGLAVPTPTSLVAEGESRPARDQSASVPGARRYRIAIGFLLVLCVALAAALTWALLQSNQPAQPRDRHHLLWSRLFTIHEPTRIVLGDSGLVLFHAVTHQYVSLDDFLTENYSRQLAFAEHADTGFARFLLKRRYTSLVDAIALNQLMRLPEAMPDRTLVQFSRDMRLNDFKNGNLILIGAQESDPWLELFERQMDFVFTSDNPQHKQAFLNRDPLRGESARYPIEEATSPAKVYGVVALLPNLSATGNVLILEGLNMAGTEAALDLVMDDRRLLPMLNRIRLKDGTLPHFEMLIESDVLNDSPDPARLVAMHVHEKGS